jgi:raffinose/stachyose/melibiose transport system permease protein
MASQSSANAFIFCRATSLAVPVSPSIDKGSPQHVCSMGNTTSTFAALNTFIAASRCCGYMKSCPIEIEESAMVDGCTPVRTFFSIVLPILQPTYVTTAILETMWIWNDYLLPYLVLNLKKFKTIPIAIQYLKGGYGSVDMGAMMAMLVLSILPIVILYLFLQKYIIKGMVAGAVKG